jgi:tetratricopeptide (TPR) repeat protein
MISDRKSRRALIAAGIVAGVVVVWLAAGVRQLDPGEAFGVLDGPLPGPFPMRVDGGWALAPPGLLRLHRYPLQAIEVPLPGAREARIPGVSGTRFGFEGWATVRADPERWKELHDAAGPAGVRGAVARAAVVAGTGIDTGIHADLGGRSFRQELSARLERELAARGLELRRLDLVSLDYLTASADEPVADPGTRLLVVGLDGADWEILDPLLEQGRMPNLARLVNEGVRAKLLTISPMLSPVIWTTVATGVEPSRHGILDFLVHDEEGGGRQPVTSRQRRVPTVWGSLGEAGVDVGVVAWWATWPAEEVRGYLVSDRLAYQLFDYRSDPDDAGGKTWPPDLYDEIRSEMVAPDAIPWERVVSYLSGPRTLPEEFDAEETELLEGLRTLLAAGDSYIGIAQHLGQRFRPRFEAVYLEGTDTIGHLFMRYRPPRLPGVEDERYESFRGMVDRYYEQADAYLGRLLEGKGEDWTILVLSDHGFASDMTRPRTADSRIGHGQAASWHRRFGMLVLSGKHVRRGQRMDEASVYDIAPTILALFGQPFPRSWPGRALSEAFEDGFFDRYPVRFRADEPEPELLVAEDEGGEGEELSRDMLAKLEALGYLSSSPDSAEGQPQAGDSLTYRNNSGVALMAEGRHAEAEEMFRAGLADHPDHPMLLVNLAMALRKQGRTEEGGVYLLKALEQPSSARQAAFHLAQDALRAGDLDGADGYLEPVLEREPDAAEILNLRGLIREKQGRQEDAARLYRRAADLDPDAAQPRVNLGNMALRRGDTGEAERWYLEAIEADPYFMGAYNNLAMVYQDRGEPDKAIDLYGRALEKSPSNAVVLNNLASLYYAIGEIDEATTHWRRCARIAPEYPSPYNNLAGVALTRGEYDEAERLIATALELDPGYGDARMNLANLHLARGEIEAARDELNRAGEAYTVLGRVGEALGAWRRSLEIDPTQEQVRRRVDELGGSER